MKVMQKQQSHRQATPGLSETLGNLLHFQVNPGIILICSTILLILYVLKIHQKFLYPFRSITFRKRFYSHFNLKGRTNCQVAILSI